jgi:hypothetical protein
MRALQWPASRKKSRGRKGFLVAERSQAPGRREEGKNLMRRGGRRLLPKNGEESDGVRFRFFVFFFMLSKLPPLVKTSVAWYL